MNITHDERQGFKQLAPPASRPQSDSDGGALEIEVFTYLSFKKSFVAGIGQGRPVYEKNELWGCRPRLGQIIYLQALAPLAWGRGF